MSASQRLAGRRSWLLAQRALTSRAEEGDKWRGAQRRAEWAAAEVGLFVAPVPEASSSSP